MNKIPDITPELENLYASNTEALLVLGGKEWIKRRKRMKNKSQEDQLREIEEKKVEDR